MKNRFYRQFGKRLLDLAIVLLLAPFWIPVVALLGFVVRIALGGPVLFRQTRPGLRARSFQLCKFRTMTDQRDAQGTLLPDEIRLTKFGRWLRSSSLDELPELWNVLRGEMSLVGPRPLLVRYLDRYTPRQARRHEMRPGITGWAQVNGRNALDWETKFELDVWYVENCSLLLDLKILILTVLAVTKRSGIQAQGHATMPEFQGTSDSHRQAFPRGDAALCPGLICGAPSGRENCVMK